MAVQTAWVPYCTAAQGTTRTCTVCSQPHTYCMCNQPCSPTQTATHVCDLLSTHNPRLRKCICIASGQTPPCRRKRLLAHLHTPHSIEKDRETVWRAQACAICSTLHNKLTNQAGCLRCSTLVVPQPSTTNKQQGLSAAKMQQAPFIH